MNGFFKSPERYKPPSRSLIYIFLRKATLGTQVMFCSALKITQDHPMSFLDPKRISPEKYARKWRKWMKRWSTMSFTQFLSSDIGSDSESKSTFRPWPKIAIDCITDINYIANPEVMI